MCFLRVMGAIAVTTDKVIQLVEATVEHIGNFDK